MPLTASAGVDMTETIGLTRRSSTAVRATDTPKKSVTVLPTHFEALLRSLPPTACPTLTVVPIARPTIITVSICITCEPIDTAVVAAVPSNWPMIKRSAMP